MICKLMFLITFLNEPELIFFMPLNGFKPFYLKWIILFTIDHLLHTVKWSQELLCITKNSI